MRCYHRHRLGGVSPACWQRLLSRKEVKPMETAIQIVLLATAVLELITAVLGLLPMARGNARKKKDRRR